MPTIICPNCRSSNIRRSRTRGIKEHLLKLIGRKAFRCKECGWRGLLIAPGAQDKRVEKRKSYVFAIVFGIIVIALILIFNIRDDVIDKLAKTIFGTPR